MNMYEKQTEVQPIPGDYKGIIPYLTVSDAKKAIEFYKKAFGAEEIDVMEFPADGRVAHAEMKMGDYLFFLSDNFPEMSGGKKNDPATLGGTAVFMFQYVEDVDATIAKAEAAGATVINAPEDMFWGDRRGMIQDPFGHKWIFCTHIKDMSPEEVEAASKEALADMMGGEQ